MYRKSTAIVHFLTPLYSKTMKFLSAWVDSGTPFVFAFQLFCGVTENGSWSVSWYGSDFLSPVSIQWYISMQWYMYVWCASGPNPLQPRSDKSLFALYLSFRRGARKWDILYYIYAVSNYFAMWVRLLTYWYVTYWDLSIWISGDLV